VGRDQQPRAHRGRRTLALEREPHAVRLLRQVHDPRRPQDGGVAELGQPRLQRRAQLARRQHRTEALQPVVRRVQPHRAEVAAAADVDLADRRWRRRQVAPHAECLQGVDAGPRQRQVALVEARRRRGGGTRRGLHLRHTPAAALQGAGQAGAHQATADDDDVETLLHVLSRSCRRRHRVCYSPQRLHRHAKSTMTTDTANRPQGPLLAGAAVLSLMIVAAALTRLLPHPPNFSPVEAVALFGGAYFASRAWAIAVPLIAMFLSDLALGLANGGIYFEYFASAHFAAIYLCIA